MTFPDRKFDDAGAYCDAYFEQMAKAAASIDRARVAEAAAILGAAYSGGNTVFVCGNGGSSAIANTFLAVHLKLVRTDTDLKARVVSLSDNIPIMTAIANDISYDDVFAFQLGAQARDGDVLVTVSSSGNSENVVRAVTTARDAGMPVIAMTGFGGGRSRDMATVSLHVTADNYGVIEDTHQCLMHLLGQYLRQAHMPPALVAERTF